MNSFENLHSRIILHDVHPLSAKTRQAIGLHAHSLTCEKGSLICEPGEVLSKLFIIKKGLVRGYYKLNGREITTWISTNEEVFTSVNFFTESPANEFIEAIETTYVEFIEYSALRDMFDRFHDFRYLNRRLLEMYIEFAEKRALISRIPNATDRFTYFAENYHPEIVKRTPKKYLASFLNIRPETLSRLLANLNQK